MKFEEVKTPDKYQCYQNPGIGHVIAKCVLEGAIVTLLFTGSVSESQANSVQKDRICWIANQPSDMNRLVSELTEGQKTFDMLKITRLNALSALTGLKDGWDGINSIAPNKEIIMNARHLVSVLSSSELKNLHPEDIYATSYGSIIFDFETRRGLVSVEIGDKDMGFYTDFSEGDNYAAEGISTDFVSVPEVLELYIS